MTSGSSLRGAGFAPALAAQRAYAAKGGSKAKLGLVVPEAFVRGIRDLGYRSNGDALAELIDNAIQAYADRIDVVFGFDEHGSAKKPSQVAVIDNGHGMEPDMIRMAVMWGGTHRENDRHGLGRYGYGLPCASVSLGRRFTVYSVVEGGDVHAVTIDLDQLTSGKYTDRSGEIVVPAARQSQPPPFVMEAIEAAHGIPWRTGTVIVIEKLDRLEWTTVQGLRDNLGRQFGVTYHKLRGEAALYVDGQFVEPIDPLFTNPGFGFHDLDGDRAHGLDPVRVEARDPGDGRYLGAITLRYAWLPPSFGSIDKGRDAVGMNANPRFAIMKDYHGLVFSRNGRLIDVQTRTPWTTLINNDRYIKIEVEFSASLDEAFGVTTSKQQVTVSPFAWDLLFQAGLPKAIEQLRIKVKEAKLRRRVQALTPGPDDHRLSERVMAAPGDPTPRQGELDLAPSRYHVDFAHEPGAAFFRVDNSAGTNTLHLNMAHRFFTDVYDGPASSPDLRAALEIMLFAFGDAATVAADAANPVPDARLAKWSRRLDEALTSLAAHLAESEGEEDSDGGLPGFWDDAS